MSVSNKTTWKRFTAGNKIASSTLVMCHYPVKEMSDAEMERRFLEKQRKEILRGQVKRVVGTVQR